MPKSTKSKEKVKETKKVTKNDGYDRYDTIKKYKNRELKTVTYKITDDKKFAAKTNLKNIQKHMEEQYADKRFYIKILGPAGWRTVGGNDGLRWDDYEDYFKGKVKDPSKFIDDIDEISVVFR